MSMVAIFRMSCCGRKVAHGRFRGDEMYAPTKAKCPFGCPTKLMPNSVTEKRPQGIVDRPKLIFVEYLSEELVPAELMATWKHGHSTGDLWHQYNRAWLKRKEAQALGAA